MTKNQAYRLCKKLNNQGRDVSEHTLFNTTAPVFWNQCQTEANFLIHGGSANQRTAMLVEQLKDFRRRSSDAVVVLTGSALTEDAVTKAAKSGELGAAVVSSPRFPNYHPLHRLDPLHITRLLMDLAARKGYGDSARLENYINGFIRICQKYHIPSLDALIQLDRQYCATETLVQLGQASGIHRMTLDALLAYPEGAHILRNLLQIVKTTYKNIANPNAGKRTNLLTAVAAKQLICINVNSPDPWVMDRALAAELQQLLSSQSRFLLVLNDVPLYDAEGLYKQTIYAKNVSSAAHVGICTGSAHSWASAVPGTSDSAPSLLHNLQSVVMFHNPNENDGDTDQILQYLGQYDKHEVTVGGGHGANLFQLFPEGHWNVVHVGRVNRVEGATFAKYRILLKGHKGRHIDLYHDLKL